jgi:hypothetical protein
LGEHLGLAAANRYSAAHS